MFHSIRELLIAWVILLGAAGSLFGSDVRIEYLGHISVPQVPYEDKVYTEGRHFGYSRGTFCYIPERNSFLLIGHPYSQKFAELSNPGPGQRATMVHDFFDPTQGAHAEQEREIDSQIHLQAMLYDRGRVYLSGEKWYNVTGTHIRTHGSFSAKFDDPEFSGWWRVGNWSGQLTGYYMARIPDEYVENGNWLLTGGSVSWRGGSSAGPCAILANPDGAVAGSRVPSSELLTYRAGHDHERNIDFANPLHKGVSLFPGSVDGWMGNCNVGGAVVVGDRLIFFGRQGKGYDFYGPNDDYTRLTGLKDSYGGKGYKSGPHDAVMWIYNLDALKQGDRSVVRMTFPWALSPLGHCDLRNACVHEDTLYVSEAFGEMFGDEPLPVIHALRIR
ncbi:MAG: hypothetical protein O3B13_17565 [Planctomycetota bacterium]|nr:hypothetical protein [Planctomycetota bacterium]